MVIMSYSEEERRRILADARKQIDEVHREHRAAVPPIEIETPLERWKREAAEIERRNAEGKRELRRQERRERKQAPALTWEMIEQYVRQCIAEHVQALQADLLETTRALADGLAAIADDRDALLKEQNKTIEALRVEVAKLTSATEAQVARGSIDLPNFRTRAN
jgi:hypothetical protein